MCYARTMLLRRDGVLALGIALFAVPLLDGAVRAGTTPRSELRFEAYPSGEMSLVARGVPITQALDAVAEKAQLEVLVYGGPVVRPPVNLVIPTTSVEDLLRGMLHGRNYALVYDADGDEVSRVILLPPSTAGRAAVSPPRRRAARGKAKAKAPAPIVIRN